MTTHLVTTNITKSQCLFAIPFSATIGFVHSTLGERCAQSKLIEM